MNKYRHITWSDYVNTHKWVRETYGKANECQNVACKGISKKYEYALKKGAKYERDINNYIKLCKTCHTEYDRDQKKWERNTDGIQIRVSPQAHKKLKILSAKEDMYIRCIIDKLLNV